MTESTRPTASLRRAWVALLATSVRVDRARRRALCTALGHRPPPIAHRSGVDPLPVGWWRCRRCGEPYL